MSRKKSSGIARSPRSPGRHRLLCTAILALVPLTVGCAPDHDSFTAVQEPRPSSAVVCGLAAGKGPRIVCYIRISFPRGAETSEALKSELNFEDRFPREPSKCSE
jgi:hypothetical protein